MQTQIMVPRMKGSPNLEVLSEKTLHLPADPGLVAYCPSMDLLALGTIDQQVLIYRLNGQPVDGAAQKDGKLRVESIKWKPNGQLLAMAWSDGSVRLVGVESTKIVHHFNTGDGVLGVTCMGWASNIINKTSSSAGSRNGPGSWEDVLSGDVFGSGKTPLDLPRDLSLIDIETSLPKLSVLASGGTSDDVFSSRSSLDALFRPFDPKDNDAVNVMVVGTKEGNIHLSIYDSFVVGSFKAPVLIGGVPARLALHASHEQYSTHALLMKGADNAGSLYFVPMDLRFVSASSGYLSLLASRSTALHNLLRYIHQVQNMLVSEWKSTQELPGKFLRNINETLAEKDNRDIVQALYHSVATGHTFPSVKRWLVDELSERGLKRWDKTVTTGLENLKRLVHEHMLPALDRCSVILSRFAGIAKFQGSNNNVGFSSQQISLIMDTIACLHLVSSKILLQLVKELDLFTSFCAWLRYEIDRLASDGSAAQNDDAADKESSINHRKVLRYIQTALTSSPLAVYFGELTTEDYNQGWNQAEQGLPLFDLLDKQLQKQERGLPYMSPLPKVELLCKFLTRQANTIFGQIAEAEKRNVLFGDPYEIGVSEKGPMDMKMSKVTPTLCQTYIAFVPEGQSGLIQIARIELVIKNGISGTPSICSSVIQLGDGRVKDIKISNEHLLVLWESKGVTSLLSIPYRSSENTDAPGASQMKYSASKTSAPHPRVFSNEELLKRFSKYGITTEGSFVAESIEIREQNRKSEKGEGGRIVVLGKDRLHYKVFKLASHYSENRERNGDITMS